MLCHSDRHVKALSITDRVDFTGTRKRGCSGASGGAEDVDVMYVSWRVLTCSACINGRNLERAVTLARTSVDSGLFRCDRV